ncbi:MAG TPA: glycosyltransferase family 39 protein [bacterium]|nr:glycosyltransferase family 39 protein [bacterium]
MNATPGPDRKRVAAADPLPPVDSSELDVHRQASDFLFMALLLVILTRLAFILLPRVPVETKAVASIGDSGEYIALARNLVAHHTFSRDVAPPWRPELFRTPAYPLLLTIPYIINQPASLGPRRGLYPLRLPRFILFSLILQFLLSMLTVWLTWRLGLELELGPVPAALAALLVGLSPNLAFLSSKLISEALFIPLLLIFVLLFNRFRSTGRAADIIAAGICTGLLILTRPIATFFPLLLAVYIFWLAARRRKWVTGISNAVLLLAVTSVTILPWVIRNGVRTGRYIISTASEHNVYLYDAATVLAAENGTTIAQARDSMMAQAVRQFGQIDTNDEATMWQKLAAVARPHLLRRPALAASVWLMGVAEDFVSPISMGPLLIHAGGLPAQGSANLFQSSLGLLAKGKVIQAFRTAWQVRLSGASTFILAVLALAALFNFILIMFGLVSLFLRRTRGLLWLLLPILYFTLVTGTVGDARFRAPIEPLLCFFAAVALIRPPRPAPSRTQAQPVRRTANLDEGSCSVGLAQPGIRPTA